MIAILRSSILLAICFTSVLAISVRDAGTTLLVNDLLRLDDAIKNITYAAGNYTGGTTAYQPIRTSFAQVNRTNRIAYYDAMTIKPRIKSDSPQICQRSSTDTWVAENVADSNRIIAVVANPIAPDITAAVNALIAKKAFIDAAGLANETAAGLNLISYDHDTLSLVAVAPKLDPSTIPAASPPVLRIDLDWRRGVVAFGGIPLAPITM